MQGSIGFCNNENKTVKTGIIFDIKEMAIHDGPGLRTTVFMKGCPLRCQWCHNPEGLDAAPQQANSNGDTRTVGREYTSAELAELLNSQADIFRTTGGGFTFSGGEPLKQAPFLAEVIDQLHKTHLLLDTSGYASAEDFALLLPKVDHVYYDLKLLNDEEHRRWTGVSNQPILDNLYTMDRQGTPYTIRFPLIPQITDTESNLKNLLNTIEPLQNLSELHILPYNALAGGKYETYGMRYTLGNEPCSSESIKRVTKIFRQLKLKHHPLKQVSLFSLRWV